MSVRDWRLVKYIYLLSEETVVSGGADSSELAVMNKSIVRAILVEENNKPEVNDVISGGNGEPRSVSASEKRAKFQGKIFDMIFQTNKSQGSGRQGKTRGFYFL